MWLYDFGNAFAICYHGREQKQLKFNSFQTKSLYERENEKRKGFSYKCSFINAHKFFLKIMFRAHYFCSYVKSSSVGSTNNHVF